MKPTFTVEANPTGQKLKQALDSTFGAMGVGCVTSVIDVSLVAGNNKVAHGFVGGVPSSWTVNSPEGPYVVHQYQAPDKNFLYLYVTGGALRCKIEVK